jgi:hypothetical protein
MTITMNQDSDQALSQFISQEAKKKGLSSKDARKALKKLKSGGMMAQVAPQLHSQFMEMNPNITARDKLQMKMQKLREGRVSKHGKAMAYEKTRQDMHERQEREHIEQEEKKEADENRKRNHRKRLKELEKRLGTVSQELYNRCMVQLQNNNYPAGDEGPKNRDRNIVELYGQQQEFKEQIDMDELDKI